MFFEGALSPTQLRIYLEEAVITPESIEKDRYESEEKYEIAPKHLVMLCNAVLKGEIDSNILIYVGSSLLSSDYFSFDPKTEEGRRISDIIIEWANLKEYERINSEAVVKYRNRLLTGNAEFSDPDWEKLAKKNKN